MIDLFERKVNRRVFGQVEFAVSGDCGTTKVGTDRIQTSDWCINVKRSHRAGHVVKMMDNNSKTNSGRESQSKKARWKAEEQVERRSVGLRRQIAQYKKTGTQRLD
jgi:hypothetical protein